MTQTVEINQDRRLTIEIAELFPIQGEWTEADYFRLPETNRIIELSEGRLIIAPSPTSQHQIILSNLFLLVGNHVLSKKLGKIVTSPMDVKLWNGKIRQPDIVFMSNEHKDRITDESWGVPDLVMEILSEHTAREDRTKKFSEYAKAGISEYWIVDPLQTEHRGLLFGRCDL
jgi:Uma2 family endonuclease